MKTKEELNALKEELEALKKKLVELTDEEMVQVVGGGQNYWLPKNPPWCGAGPYLGKDPAGKWPYKGCDNEARDNAWGPHWGE